MFLLVFIIGLFIIQIYDSKRMTVHVFYSIFQNNSHTFIRWERTNSVIQMSKIAVISASKILKQLNGSWRTIMYICICQWYRVTGNYKINQKLTHTRSWKQAALKKVKTRHFPYKTIHNQLFNKIYNIQTF